MKNLILLLSAISLIQQPLTLRAQTKTVVYDFQEGEIKGVEPVKTNEFVLVKVININTFKYQVKISGLNVDYTTPIPSELQTVFRLRSDEDEGDPSEPLGAVEGAAIKMVELSDEAMQQDSESTPEFQAIMEQLAGACQTFVKHAREVANIKFARMELINISKQKWDNYDQLVNSEAFSLIRVPSREAMKKSYQDFISSYVQAEALYRKAKDQVEKDDWAKAQQGKANDDQSNSEEREKSPEEKLIESANEEIEEGYESLESDHILDLIEDVIALHTALSNSNNFEVHSAPVQVDGDYVHFDVRVKPLKVNALLPIEHSKTAIFEVPAKKGWTVDFSVGPTMSFSDGAKDDLIFLEPDPASATSAFVRKTDDDNAIRPGLAAMIHAYPRRGKYGAFGFMFGLGAGFESIEDPDLALYLGGTEILGKRNKVMLSLGLTAQRVDRIKSQFSIGGSIDAATPLADLTNKVFRFAPFISLSYNISNRVIVDGQNILD